MYNVIFLARFDNMYSARVVVRVLQAKWLKIYTLSPQELYALCVCVRFPFASLDRHSIPSVSFLLSQQHALRNVLIYSFQMYILRGPIS